MKTRKEILQEVGVLVQLEQEGKLNKRDKNTHVNRLYMELSGIKS